MTSRTEGQHEVTIYQAEDIPRSLVAFFLPAAGAKKGRHKKSEQPCSFFYVSDALIFKESRCCRRLFGFLHAAVST
jgi:hypothetical protein